VAGARKLKPGAKQMTKYSGLPVGRLKRTSKPTDAPQPITQPETITLKNGVSSRPVLRGLMEDLEVWNREANGEHPDIAKLPLHKQRELLHTRLTEEAKARHGKHGETSSPHGPTSNALFGVKKHKL
jgi:hypothetical protein